MAGEMNIFVAFLFLLTPQEIRETSGVLDIKPVIDYEAGLVYYEEWIDTFYMGILYVESLEKYLAGIERNLSVDDFKNRMRNERGKADIETVEGIIPDINIQMGKEKTTVSVSGQDRITLGSSATFFPPDSAEQDKTNPLSGIELKQDLNVSVTGTIARKTKVTINHSSGSNQLTSDNKIQISYTGDDDEIVKKIEAGDVSLNLPSKQSIPAQAGLFGINAQIQLGPVDLYAVVSREETQSGSEEYTGQSQTQTAEYLDKDYIENKYFYVFHEGIGWRDNIPDTLADSFHLYLDNSTGDVPEGEFEWRGLASPYGDTMMALDSGRADEIETNKYFYELTKDEDYELWKHPLGWVIELKSSLYDNSVLAVACTTSNFSFGSRYPREINGSDTAWGVNLLLVKGKNPDTSDICWTNMRRNHYNIPGRLQEGETSIKLKILYRKDGSRWVSYTDEGESYSSLLNLTGSNSDIHTLSFHEQRLEELIFEDPYPFTDSVLGDTVHDIYWSRDINDANVGGKYKIEFEYESVTGTYDLGPFLKEGSVKVYINEQLLPSSKYKVDYATGSVEIKESISPSDNIEITFEKEELFSMDRKSLLGFRAQSQLTDGIEIGSSLLYRKVGFSGESRPTLQLEPYSRTVADLDLSVNQDVDFLTKFLDWLPLISTEEKSTFVLNGVSAVSLPNANTHNSGSVWIEDFESIRETRSVDLSVGKWYQTSLPMRNSLETMDTSFYSRVRPLWKISENFFKGVTIYGDPDLDDPNTTIPPDNAFQILWDEPDASTWSGILGSSPYFMDISEAENLELIMNTGTTTGTIHFDFGTIIDEDQLRLNADGEIVGYGGDEPDSEYESGDKTYYSIKDKGLDGVGGVDGMNVEGDDGNDDYNNNPETAGYNPNGTEANNRLDSEDLEPVGFDRGNDYYEFTFDLSDPNFTAEYVDSLGLNSPTGWIRVSVPLTLTDTSLFSSYGSPDETEIQVFRIWFEGMEDSLDSLQIYSWQFVGNKWKEPTIFALDSSEIDSSEHVFIDIIGTQNKDYEPPFSLGKTINNQTEQDNSLQMIYENIAPSHATRVTRWDYAEDDFRGYERIRIYVHNKDPDPSFYLRLGNDSLTYYEVRSQISDGSPAPNPTDPDWYEFVFTLKDLIDLKSDYYSNLPEDDTTSYPIVASQDSSLFVKGKPSMSLIKYFELGIINNTTSPITGEVWFNDVRLEGPVRNIGTNVSVNGRLNLADIADLSANYSNGNGKFTPLGQGSGPLTTGVSESATINTTLHAEKFGLDRLGFSIPVKYTYKNTKDKPLYDGEMPDVELQEADQIERMGNSKRQSITLNFSHSQSKSKKNKLIEYTLDGLSGSFSIDTSLGRRDAGLEEYADKNETYSLNYSVNPDLKFKLFNQEFSYFLSKINFTGGVGKKHAFNRERNSYGDDWFDPNFNDNTSLNFGADLSYSPVKYLPLDVNYSEGHAQYDDRDTSGRNQITVNDILQDGFYKRDLDLSARTSSIDFKQFGSPSVSVNSNFSENHTFNLYESFYPRQEREDSQYTLSDTLQVRNLNNSSSMTFKWNTFSINGIVSKQSGRVQNKLDDYQEELEKTDTLKEESDASAGEMMLEITQDTLTTDSVALDSLLSDTVVYRTPTEKRLDTRVKRWEFLDKATKIFQPVSVSATFGRSSSFDGYQYDDNGNAENDFIWKDDWRYVTGIDDTIDHGIWTSMGWGRSETYNLSSGLNLWDVSINGSTDYRYTETLQPSGDLKYTVTTTLPSLRLNYSQLGKLLGKAVKSSQLSMNAKLSNTYEGYLTSESNSNTRDTTSFGTDLICSPLLSWNTKWEGQVSSDLMLNYTVYNGVDNWIDSTWNTWDSTTTIGGSATITYIFSKPSGFKLPLLKHIKFKNDLTVEGTFGYEREIAKRNDYTIDDSLVTHVTDLYEGTLHTQYTFSEAFDGGLDISVAKTVNDELRKKDNKTDLNFNFFVVFKF